VTQKKKITGKDLIQMGYRQGKWFKDALTYVNQHRLYGTQLKDYLDKSAPVIIAPHQSSIPFYKNIVAESEEEAANINAVENSMIQVMKTPTVVTGAIMPDACPAGPIGTIPVGGVVVTKNAIHPAMHSADICCSVMMTNFGHVPPKKVLDHAYSITHFGFGGRENPFDLPKDLTEQMKENYFLKDEKSQFVSKSHLGTQGDGNHFLYVGQSASSGDTIMVTHHGSRGLGAHLYKRGMAVAENIRKEISPSTLKHNAWIPFDDIKGQQYWQALQIIREWTKLNHFILHQEVMKALKTQMKDHFWNEHNFVFKEDDLFYHAKGATPLLDQFVPDADDSRRLIPLNMSEPILIVEGNKTQNNLGFAPHGAGRNMSRSQHIRNNSNRKISDIFESETQGLDIRFFSGHTDISELPSAYKNAQTVQRQMKEFNLGNVVDEIIPYGCIMAGDWKKDAPWRKKKSK